MITALLPLMSLMLVNQKAGNAFAYFKDLAETRSYTLGRPGSFAFTPGGEHVLFLRSGARDPVLRLYELHLATGKVRELCGPEALIGKEDETQSAEEKARRERMRLSLRGITHFELSRDGSRVLVSLSGRLWLLGREDGRIVALPGDGWIDPKLSPDGRWVAAVHEREVHVIDLRARASRRLTAGAKGAVSHGLAEFVAQEEMHRFSGFWWSPDGSAIAYQETDESDVETLYIPDPARPEKAPEARPYPRAGTANARVRLGIVRRAGGSTTWVSWDAERFPYLARVTWEQEKAPLTILVQSRSQREEKLLAVDARTGRTRELLTERDEAWVNLDRDARIPWWLSDGKAFLWTTERQGDWQLELRGGDGALIRSLTPLGFRYSGIGGVDERRRIALLQGGPDPRETHVYRVSLDGGEPERKSEGMGLHHAILDRSGAAWIQISELWDGTWRARVRDRRDEPLAELPSVAETPKRLPRAELVRVGIERSFDALVIRPHDFEPGRKYPVVVHVYGGPGAKVVKASPYLYFRQQWLADQGYIVVSIDGRGTPGHGRDWERAIAGDLASIALEDQTEGLRLLGERYPEMDPGRVGITGWSFGGYMTIMALLRRPEVFHAGAAGAPVTDWADYDTHYTERYMGLPKENVEGYRRANALTHVAGLEGPLLLVHGITDDNVYFVHTLKLVDALFREGKRFDLLPLASTHMVYEPAETTRLQMRLLEHFERHLKPRPSPSSRTASS